MSFFLMSLSSSTLRLVAQPIIFVVSTIVLIVFVPTPSSCCKHRHYPCHQFCCSIIISIILVVLIVILTFS
jgi:hypothetical protein